MHIFSLFSHLFSHLFVNRVLSNQSALKFVRKYSSSKPAGLARILASDPIDSICAKQFAKYGHELVEKPGISKDELIKIIGEYDGLVVRSGTRVTQDILESGTNLKVVGRAGTGVDNIDVSAATNRGILVVNTPGGNTISTGELALSHILSLARNIPQATAALKEGRWDRSKYTGTELTGKTLGVIGIGRIGREVASWCRGFGMKTVGYDPVLSEQVATSYKIDPVSLEELFAQSDFITIHTPLTKETSNLICKKTLATMKKGVRIINCARGGIVNEKDLLESLDSGHVAGASLDVFSKEPPEEDSLALRKHPNVIVTPHLGASTVDAQLRVAKAIATNMSEIFDGGDFTGVINAPDLGAVSKMPQLVPYVMLAEKMGSIQAQLLQNNRVTRISIVMNGKDVAEKKATEVITAAVLKGALGELISQPVSFVNATGIAEQLGVKTTITSLPDTDFSTAYNNTLTVLLEIEGSLNFTRSIEGTVFGRNELRISKVDGIPIDLPTGEHILLFNNQDVPGVLRKIATKLSENNININHFSQGRAPSVDGVPSRSTLCALVIDKPVPAAVIECLEREDEIYNMTPLKLSGEVDPRFRVAFSDSDNFAILGSSMPPVRPKNPEFSSGPCKKRPGYNVSKLRTDTLGRSHRSKVGKQRLKKAILDTKRILNIPEDYLCGIVPASDTGAYELAMWNMLGPKPIDACYWESFGQGWKTDAVTHLGLQDQLTEYTAPYGTLPDLASTNKDHDILFTFNGTTSGVKVPNLDWISDDRTGLTFNDATSAAFAMDMDWSKVDVTTYSWQKVLGGEGGHGVLILSPRAVERLESFTPENRPLPKIFRLTKKGKVDMSIFEGSTINTPSMLCVEDYIDALEWAESIGGLPALIAKSEKNLNVIERFVDKNSNWIQFLCKEKDIRSNTSVCLTLPKLDKDQVKRFISILENENVALDIGAYRDAPDGLRIWCGATVEEDDLTALLPWLEVCSLIFCCYCHCHYYKWLY